jgi:hypothetical protein
MASLRESTAQYRDNIHPFPNRAQTVDKNWGIARTFSLWKVPETISLMEFPDRLLMPVFGATAVRDMFPAMEDVIYQLVDKWERRVSLRPTPHNHGTKYHTLDLAPTM